MSTLVSSGRRALLPAAVLAHLLAGGPAATNLEAQPTYRDGEGTISFALVGDAIASRKLSVYQEPEFLRLREIIHEATVGFANAEILFHEYGDDIIPAAQSGGTYMAAHPEIAKELAWMGFDIMSMANNHTMDYGAGGMRSTMKALDAAGIRYAGAGENLAEARAPAYVETPHGRVALISVSSTFAEHMRAGHQRRDMRGRPGLSPIRYTTTYVVPEADLASLRGVRSGLGLGGRDGEREITLFGNTFRAGDDYRVVTEPHQGDLDEIAAQVRDAKRQANWVIVTSHTHEGDGDREVPAQFLVRFARAMIDAGADIFTGHGPHVLRGIEIYEGKPIFYSLADFIFQNETVPRQPADNYERYGLTDDALPADFYDGREEAMGGGWPADPLFWDSALAWVAFRQGRLAEVRLHPVIIGHGQDRAQRGRPLHASGQDARRILERLQRLSEPFGTRIDVVDGVGVVRIPAGAATQSGR